MVGSKKVKKVPSMCKKSLKKLSVSVHRVIKKLSLAKALKVAKATKLALHCPKRSAKKVAKPAKKSPAKKAKSPKSHKKHANPWIKHLSSFRKSHPKVHGKQVMKQAKKSYKPKK